MPVVIRLLIPFIYAGAFIIAPIYFFHFDYLPSVIFLFWVPANILYLTSIPWLLTNPAYHKTFWFISVAMVPVTVGMEYLCLWLDIWNFSARKHLIGIWIYGAPVEEFVFWFGATPFIILVYFYFKRAVNGD